MCRSLIQSLRGPRKMQFYSVVTSILVGILVLLTAHGQQPKLSDVIKENIIKEVFTPDPGLAASAIRLSFHDCVGSCIGDKIQFL